MSETLSVFLSILLGAIVGSFLNVVILRIPDKAASIIFPPSHCPGCKTKLNWYDNIPVVSYILLRGRCRQCKMSISKQYPLIELAMAVVSYSLYVRFSLSTLFWIYFFFCAALLVIIVIDSRHQIIPDAISIPGILGGFAVSFINPATTWQSSAIGILLGGGSLYAIAVGYYVFTKREGMGGGDIKLLAMIGAFLGWQSLPFVVFGSSLLGSVVGIGAMLKQGKGGKTVIPYGPFLSVAAIIYLYYEREIREFFVMFFLPPS